MVDDVVGVVKVKPLVWSQDPYNCGEDWFHRASRGGYLYEVGCAEDGSWWWKEDGIVDISAITVDGDIETAKAAAQADYDARIMAALDVQPIAVQDAARVPEIAEAIAALDDLTQEMGFMLRHNHDKYGRQSCSRGIAALRAIADTD